MVFVAGPRQVGKTTLARSLPGASAGYLSWDILKWVHFEQGAQGRDMDLRYFRDTDGREVDFVLVEGRRPFLFVEARWGDAEPDRSLRYLKARFPEADAWQVSATGRKDFVTPEGIRVSPALELLSTLV